MGNWRHNVDVPPRGPEDPYELRPPPLRGTVFGRVGVREQHYAQELPPSVPLMSSRRRNLTTSESIDWHPTQKMRRRSAQVRFGRRCHSARLGTAAASEFGLVNGT